jgi:hypothetical protein
MGYRAKIQLILGRKEERLILALLIILVVATLADPICLQLHVKPSLLAAGAVLHLLGGECLVEFRFDGEVFFVEGRLLVGPCKPGGRLVEFAGRAFFGGRSCTGAAAKVSCEARASTGTTTGRREWRRWWPSQGGASASG